MMDTNEILRSALGVFLAMLRREWLHIDELARMLVPSRCDGLLSDWAQANWELLVEAPIATHVALGRTFLEPYGEGADCNAIGSRVWMPGAKPTHAVHCLPCSGETAWDHLMQAKTGFPSTGLRFERFVTRAQTGWYEETPPFDCALASLEERECLFLLTDVKFVLHEVSDQR